MNTFHALEMILFKKCKFLTLCANSLTGHPIIHLCILISISLVALLLPFMLSVLCSLFVCMFVFLFLAAQP